MVLSFIVPVYNADNFLEECLNSLICQDVDSETYEIICVNDGSTDSSSSILQRYSESNGKVIVVNIDNRGVSTARNIGLYHARGQYVWFVDSDDFIQKNVLNDLFLFLNSNSQADIVKIGAYSFVSHLSELEYRRYVNKSENKISHSNNTFVTRNIFLRSFLQKFNLEFVADFAFGEDIQFINDVYLNNPKVLLYDKPLYYYRQNELSVTYSLRYSNATHIKAWLLLFNNAKNAYDLCHKNNKIIFANNLNIIVISALSELSGLKLCSITRLRREVRPLFQYRPFPECTLYDSSTRWTSFHIQQCIRMRIFKKPYFIIYRLAKFFRGKIR